MFKPIARHLLAPALLVLLCSAHAQSQAQSATPSNGADIYSAAELAVRSAALQTKAMTTPNGQAGGKLGTYPPNNFTMLTYRSQNGVVEQHANYDDVFVVLDGDATIVTGGTGQNMHPTGKGEQQGTSIVGGKTTKLGKGDIIHISINVPHQLFIEKGHHFTYYVVKIKQVD
ncbi:MAG: hypothetical protein ACYCSN_11130 [Acidobacteriaceae bacterium]